MKAVDSMALRRLIQAESYESPAADPQGGRYQSVKISEYENSGRGEGNYFDWDDALFRTAVYQSYDLSVSGGTDKSTYYSSFSYTDEQGRVKINGFSRFSGRVNLNQKVGERLELATSASISRTVKSGFNDTRSQADLPSPCGG